MNKLDLKKFRLPPLCWLAVGIIGVLFWDTILTIALVAGAVWILFRYRRRFCALAQKIWSKMKA